MDTDAKKTVLRMIPYGIYVLTACDNDGAAAATVNWVTQTAFVPPRLVVGVKAESGTCTIVKRTKRFALNMLGKDAKGLAFTFFRPAELSGNKISGQPFRIGANGAPILDAAIGTLECAVRTVIEEGDHHIFVAEVTEAYLPTALSGRPDGAILEMKDLGESVFYGG